MKVAACEVRIYLGPDDTERLDRICVQQGKARDVMLRQWVGNGCGWRVSR